MESPNNCCFCVEYNRPLRSEFFVKVGAAAGVSSRVVVESDNWYVVPTLGCLVEGHVLIIPKKHILSIANLNNAMFEEMVSLRDTVEGIITKRTGKECICFEHGITNDAAVGANSVSHLHVHMVPCEKSLWGPIEEDCRIVDAICFPDYYVLYDYLQKNMPQSYLMFQDIDGSIHYIPDASFYPSQFFRIQVAKYLGTGQWDWRKAQDETLLLQTLNLFRNDSLSSQSRWAF